MQLVAFVVAWLLAQLRTAHRDERGFWNPLSSFKDIWNQLGGLVSDIRDAMGQLVSYVLSGVVNLVNVIQSALGSLVDRVTNLLAILVSVLGAALASIRDVITYVAAAIANLLRDALGHVADVVTYIGGAIANLLRDALGHVADVATYIGAAIANMLQSGLGSLGDVVTFIGASIANLVRDVLGHLADVVTFVGGGIVNAVTSTAGQLGDLVRWFGTTIANSAKDVAGSVDAVGEKAIDAALAHKDDIVAGLVFGPAGNAAEELLRQHPDALHFITKEGKWAGEHVDQVLGKGFDELLKLFTGGGHVDEGDAPTLAANFILLAGGLGFLAHVAAVPGDAAPTLSNNAKSNLAGFLGKFSGWEPAIAATLGATAALGIKRPMEQHINKRTTTNIPMERELDLLYSRRKINANSYEEGHARHGYTGTWTQVMEDASFRPLRIFELARIMVQTDIDDATLTSMLEDAGYRDEVIAPLAKALHATAQKTSATKLLTGATAAYSDGFIDATAFGAACAAAGVSPAEQGILQLAAEIDYQNKAKTEMVSVFRARAAADALSDDELRAGLAGLGVTGRKADVEVARANIARLKKPVSTAAAATKKAQNATVATLTTAYKDQFKKGVIDARQLQDQLVAIGIPDFQAAAIVTLSQAETLKTPATPRGSSPAEVAARVQKDLEAAYITQYQHDAIDDATLGTQLLAIGLSTAEVEAIVAREQAKKVPKPAAVKVLTAAAVAKQVNDTLAKAYEEQFLKGEISADELEQDFIAVGINADEAHARRLLDEAKAAKKTPPPAPSA